MNRERQINSIWPPLTIGAGVLNQCSGDWRDFAVVTTHSPWGAAERLVPKPDQLVFVGGLERAYLEATAERLRDVRSIVGIGSGLAMDASKFLAKVAGVALVQVPTTSSNNACFTRTAWTFENGLRVPERDAPIPEQIIVDTELLVRAPARMNRAGAAEILCSHTALYDWKLAAEAGLDVDWNYELARFTRVQLGELNRWAMTIGANQTDAFVEILRVGAKFAEGFTAHPKARFNSGSEHIFAWSLEQESGKRLIHGETVNLGILIMSYIQQNEPELAATTIRNARMVFRPEEIGVTWATVEATIGNLPRYASRVPWHTVINRFVDRGTSGMNELLERYFAAKAFIEGLT